MENRLILYFSGFLFLLMPWYMMQSGLPQPVDVVIILILSILALIKFPYFNLLYHSRIFRLYVYLILYTVIVLLINFIINNLTITINLIEQNVYYLILLLLFSLLIIRFQMIYGRTRCYKLMLWLIFISCILPLITWFVHPSRAIRISLTFNNPNQLGFFALVNISVVFYLGLLARDEGIKINKWLSVIILNINIIFLFLSASRACYPVALLYIFSYLILFDLKLSVNSVWLYRFGSTFVAMTAFLFLLYKMFLHMKNIRFSKLPVSYSDIAYDFYFRAIRGIDFGSMSVWNLLVGSGNYTTSLRGTLEFHNNFIAFFNQIGLLGVIFYFYLNVIIFIQLYKKGYFYFLPYCCYLFYSMFQYSYRTRLNWFFIAIIIFLTFNSNNKRRII